MVQRTLICVVVLGASALALPKVDPVLEQVREVQQSSIAVEQKVQKVRDLLVGRPTQLIFTLENIRKGEGVRAGVELFRNPVTPRAACLAIGHDLTSRFYADDLAKEFASYVLAAAFNGGEQEFIANREQGVHTAIGEIACMAGGFEGMPKPLFEQVADPRLIPILTNCLAAPDHVWSADDGCVVMGKPGEPSGHNVPRQLLPLALARLNATDAVPKLSAIARQHHDVNLQMNCAYAVAKLGDAKEVADLETHLNRKTDPRHRPYMLFSFGKGLIERGDDRGIRYLLLRESGERDLNHPAVILYTIEQRLDPMEHLHTPGTAAFYKEILENDAFRALLRHNPDQLHIPDPPGLLGHKTPADMLAQSRPRIVSLCKRITEQVVVNKLNELAPTLREISKTTRDAEIRDITQQAVQHLTGAAT